MIPFHASIRKAVAVGLKKGFAASDNLDPRRKLCPRAARWKYIQGKAHMPLKDQIKNYAKKLVENRPASSALSNMVRVRKPLALTLSRTNRAFRCFVYRGAVVLSTRSFDPATVIDTAPPSALWLHHRSEEHNWPWWNEDWRKERESCQCSMLDGTILGNSLRRSRWKLVRPLRSDTAPACVFSLAGHRLRPLIDWNGRP
jgi:hypothetical protein